MEELRRRGYAGARQSYGRGRYASVKAKPKADVRETVLTQCIVSGIILIIVLLISLIDSNMTNSIRSTVKTALSGESTIESISDGFNGIAQSYSDIKNSLNIIFGKTLEDETPSVSDVAVIEDDVNINGIVSSDVPIIKQTATDEENLADTEVFNQENYIQDASLDSVRNDAKVNESTAAIFDEDFRIDEDILAQINSKFDFYNSAKGTKIQ